MARRAGGGVADYLETESDGGVKQGFGKQFRSDSRRVTRDKSDHGKSRGIHSINQRILM
jgi:hypothetical protein